MAHVARVQRVGRRRDARRGAVEAVQVAQPPVVAVRARRAAPRARVGGECVVLLRRAGGKGRADVHRRARGGGGRVRGGGRVGEGGGGGRSRTRRSAAGTGGGRW